MNAVDLAEFISEMDPEDERLVILFRLMPKEFGAEVFAYLDRDAQQRVVQGISDKELRGIMDELFLDDTVDFIEEMPASIVRRVIKLADHETRKQINQLLMYPDDSAGSLMTTEYMEAKTGWSIAQAIASVRSQCEDMEFISTLFVTDGARHLKGSVLLKDLLAASDSDSVASIVNTNINFVSTLTDQAEVADMFKRYDLVTLPVVDGEQRLVGIISIDDIVDVIDEEATEDIYKMAAMEPIEQSYSDAGVFTLARKRIVWLAVLMISSTVTGFIIERFQAALAANVLLVSFIPMLMDTGGNASSQTSASVIRALVLKEVAFRDIFKVIWKEFRVSVIVGAGIAALNFLRVMLFNRNLLVALVVSATLFIVIVVSKIVGCVLPMFAQRIHLDPALMASPMITTIVDAVALLVYFGIASQVFGIAV